jgi:hypothetical protein
MAMKLDLDLSQYSKTAPSTPALQRQRLTAETKRQAQSQRRRRQLEEEIALAIEEAGASTPSINEHVHQGVHKIAQRLTSSRKQNMSNVALDEHTPAGNVDERQATKRTMADEDRSSPSNTVATTPSAFNTPGTHKKHTPASASSTASYNYETPVKNFRHFPIISSTSRMQHVPQTMKSEQKRRTAEKQRRSDSHARFEQMKQDIYRQVGNDVSNNSAIDDDIVKSLCGVKARLDQGRARSTIPGSGGRRGSTLASSAEVPGKPKGSSGERPPTGLARSMSEPSPRLSAMDRALPIASNGATVGGTSAATAHTGANNAPPHVHAMATDSTALEQVWYKMHRSSLLVLVIVVAFVAIVVPLRYRSLHQESFPMELETSQVGEVVGGGVGQGERESGGEGGEESGGTGPGTGTSPATFMGMFVATLAWLYGAYRVLEKRWSADKVV